MRRTLTIVALAILISPNAFSQFYKYSNEFLSIGIGARGLGMSGAQVASVGDVTAGYWNPAGLAMIDKKLEIGLMHSEYFAGIAKFDYASVALPMQDKNRILAFSLIRFGVDDIPNTLFLIEPDGSINYNNVTSFSVADYAGLISYAQKLGIEGLRLGGNLKIVHRTAGSFATSWGVGVDLGIQYDKKHWRLGALAKDITTTFNAWSFNFTEDEQAVFANTNNVIPENSIELTAPKLILGAAYKFEFGLKNQLKDAAGSIMDNIAEGFGRGSKNEFVNFLSYATGSAEETKSQLYKSLDFKLITEHVFNTFYDKVVAIIKKITSFMNYLNASLVGGQKFKGRKKIKLLELQTINYKPPTTNPNLNLPGLHWF